MQLRVSIYLHLSHRKPREEARALYLAEWVRVLGAQFGWNKKRLQLTCLLFIDYLVLVVWGCNRLPFDNPPHLLLIIEKICQNERKKRQYWSNHDLQSSLHSQTAIFIFSLSFYIHIDRPISQDIILNFYDRTRLLLNGTSNSIATVLIYPEARHTGQRWHHTLNAKITHMTAYNVKQAYSKLS